MKLLRGSSASNQPESLESRRARQPSRQLGGISQLIEALHGDQRDPLHDLAGLVGIAPDTPGNGFDQRAVAMPQLDPGVFVAGETRRDETPIAPSSCRKRIFR